MCIYCTLAQTLIPVDYITHLCRCVLVKQKRFLWKDLTKGNKLGCWAGSVGLLPFTL